MGKQLSQFDMLTMSVSAEVTDMGTFELLLFFRSGDTFSLGTFDRQDELLNEYQSFLNNYSKC